MTGTAAIELRGVGNDLKFRPTRTLVGAAVRHRFVIWPGGRICRIGIFAAGKRAAPGEVWRWIRTA